MNSHSAITWLVLNLKMVSFFLTKLLNSVHVENLSKSRTISSLQGCSIMATMAWAQGMHSLSFRSPLSGEEENRHSERTLEWGVQRELEKYDDKGKGITKLASRPCRGQLQIPNLWKNTFDPEIRHTVQRNSIWERPEGQIRGAMTVKTTSQTGMGGCGVIQDLQGGKQELNSKIVIFLAESIITSFHCLLRFVSSISHELF